MSTVVKRIWMKLLEGDGRYEDDPLPHSLWTYESTMGQEKLCFKICYEQQHAVLLLRSPCIRSPKIAWSKEGGHSDYGRGFLDEQEKSK